MSVVSRRFSAEVVVLGVMASLLVGAGAFVCVSAMRAQVSVRAVVAEKSPDARMPLLPPLLSVENNQKEIAAPPLEEEAARPIGALSPFTYGAGEEQTETPQPRVAASAPYRERLTPSASLSSGAAPPLPAPRPIEFNVAMAVAASARHAEAPALNPQRFDVSPPGAAQMQRAPDAFTAVYDLTAHTVFMPDGSRLEAHSGLGPLLDDPAHVEEKDRGATPPHLYDLTLREGLFHGVQALRLNPTGGADAIFGRAGLLAHTYMLGPNGDSNGCVSFKNYDAFLQAFQAGQIKRLAVVVSRLK